MTPNELLQDVKDRFDVFYEQDEAKLKRLLRASMQTYQEKAGFVKNQVTKDHQMDVPANNVGFVQCLDGEGLGVDVEDGERIADDGSEIPVWHIDPEAVGPFKVRYLINLRDMDLDSQLPNGCSSLIGDHLFACLDAIETKRQRLMNIASGLPADNFRTDAELAQARTDIELRMQEEGQVLPMVASC